MQARFLTLLTTLTFLAFSGLAVAHPCTDPDDEDHKHCRDGGGGGGGGNGGGAKPLCVTFNDEANYYFRSDSDSGDADAYCDGVDGVNTQIDKFRFGLNLGMNDPIRNFDLNLDCTDCKFPYGSTIGWNVFSASPDGAQYHKMGDNTPQDVNFSLVFFDVSGQGWNIQFNPDDCLGSTWVTVTKTDADTDTWVFEADGDAFACLNREEQGHPSSTYYGLHKLPFTITAVAQ
jgi:hypothetical protein